MRNHVHGEKKFVTFIRAVNFLRACQRCASAQEKLASETPVTISRMDQQLETCIPASSPWSSDIVHKHIRPTRQIFIAHIIKVDWSTLLLLSPSFWEHCLTSRCERARDCWWKAKMLRGMLRSNNSLYQRGCLEFWAIKKFFVIFMGRPTTCRTFPTEKEQPRHPVQEVVAPVKRLQLIDCGMSWCVSGVIEQI